MVNRFVLYVGDTTLIWLTVVKRKKHPTNCFPTVHIVDKIQGIQGGGTVDTTIDHSDIRGLVTA